MRYSGLLKMSVSSIEVHMVIEISHNEVFLKEGLLLGIRILMIKIKELLHNLCRFCGNTLFFSPCIFWHMKKDFFMLPDQTCYLLFNFSLIFFFWQSSLKTVWASNSWAPELSQISKHWEVNHMSTKFLLKLEKVSLQVWNSIFLAEEEICILKTFEKVWHKNRLCK